ncbi:MAG TPA: TlpA disulfide reductase family protein [Candidatus Acidoferrum sp.]|jgi:peroxiredoxin
MGLSRKLANWAAIAAAAVVILLFAMPSYRQGEASIVGSKARDFSLTLDGKSTHLSDLRGKVVVLNFWGSWCQPCVEEAPSLNRLQQHIASHNAFVLGVAADEDDSAYKKFLLDHAISYPTYRDPATRENRSAIGETYGTVMVPETYIIDRNGKIARKIIGYQQWDSPEMLAYFDALLSQS